MPGREQSAEGTRPIVYCLIPRALAPKLHELLRRHFAADPSVEVIVERRCVERRRGVERRAQAMAAGPERRQVRAVAGRRIAERRVLLLAVAAPGPLPRRAREHAHRLAFGERLEPVGQLVEDADSARLVMRIQAGDREAFSLLYMRYFDRVYGYLRLLFRDPHAAEDAAQQVFLKAFENISVYEPALGPFRGWLFVVARNFALNQLPRDARTFASADVERLREADDEREPPAGLGALDWVTDRDLFLFVERLPLVQRQVLFLRYVVGLSMAEIAELLGQTPQAARQQHARALRFLRARLAALGREPRTARRVGAKAVFRRAPVLRNRRFSLI
jgi:RNA polymerase sigma-70 factor (ECF subfamily)